MSGTDLTNDVALMVIFKEFFHPKKRKEKRSRKKPSQTIKIWRNFPSDWMQSGTLNLMSEHKWRIGAVVGSCCGWRGFPPHPPREGPNFAAVIHKVTLFWASFHPPNPL